MFKKKMEGNNLKSEIRYMQKKSLFILVIAFFLGSVEDRKIARQ